MRTKAQITVSMPQMPGPLRHVKLAQHHLTGLLVAHVIFMQKLETQHQNILGSRLR